MPLRTPTRLFATMGALAATLSACATDRHFMNELEFPEVARNCEISAQSSLGAAIRPTVTRWRSRPRFIRGATSR